MVASDDIVERIRQAADIVQIIGRYVPLRKGGRDFIGCCPFHNEKTPSFSVSPSKRFFYCFGCRESGDVFTFLMKYEGLDFNEAKRKLGDLVGIEVAKPSLQERQRKQAHAQLTNANLVAQSFFVAQLWKESSKEARRYLEKRGIPLHYAREVKMGFGGASADFFEHLEKGKIDRDLAFKAGLLGDSRERCLFEGKIVFPIFSDGNLAGFGARRIGDGSGPKYINSRESLLFQKSQLLFGWDAAQDALRRHRRAVVVEGYTDVLACHQNGIHEAMAALGTSFTPEHAKRLKRLVTSQGRVVLVLDADQAGMRASRAASIVLLENDLKPYVASLPAGEDPDSCLRKMGRKPFVEAIENAKPAPEYFMESIFSRVGMSIEERSSAAGGLAPLLAAIPSGLERDLYVARLAEKVGVSEDQLRRHLKAELQKKGGKKKKYTESVPRPSRAEKPPPEGLPAGWEDIPPPGMDAYPEPPRLSPVADEQRHPQPSGTNRELPQKRELETLRELLLYPELRPRFEELAEYAHTEVMGKLFDELSSPENSIEEVLKKHLPAGQVSALVKVEPAELDDGPEREVLANRTFNDVCRKIKKQCLQVERDDVLRELKSREDKGLSTAEFVKRLQRLSRLIRDLEAGS